VRPSGTEPKTKYYTEIRCAVSEDLDDSRARADLLSVEVAAALARV
jgi:phosphomannomutase